jgi:hypothetical protein
MRTAERRRMADLQVRVARVGEQVGGRRGRQQVDSTRPPGRLPGNSPVFRTCSAAAGRPAAAGKESPAGRAVAETCRQRTRPDRQLFTVTRRTTTDRDPRGRRSRRPGPSGVGGRPTAAGALAVVSPDQGRERGRLRKGRAWLTESRSTKSGASLSPPMPTRARSPRMSGLGPSRKRRKVDRGCTGERRTDKNHAQGHGTATRGAEEEVARGATEVEHDQSFQPDGKSGAGDRR